MATALGTITDSRVGVRQPFPRPTEELTQTHAQRQLMLSRRRDAQYKYGEAGNTQGDDLRIHWPLRVTNNHNDKTAQPTWKTNVIHTVTLNINTRIIILKYYEYRTNIQNLKKIANLI